jgi:hypothetical protein
LIYRTYILYTLFRNHYPSPYRRTYYHYGRMKNNISFAPTKYLTVQHKTAYHKGRDLFQNQTK